MLKLLVQMNKTVSQLVKMFIFNEKFVFFLFCFVFFLEKPWGNTLIVQNSFLTRFIGNYTKMASAGIVNSWCIEKGAENDEIFLIFIR